jgi:hypothetical protein
MLKWPDSKYTREVMNVRQAAAYLGMSPDTLYKHATESGLPALQDRQPLALPEILARSLDG